MMKKTFWAVALIALTQLITSAPEASAASRATKKIGLSIGLLTEPFPSVIGYSLSYNLFKQLRLTAGYGSISATGTGYTADLTTIAADAKLFVVDWNFAPFVSAGFSNVSGTITGTSTAGGTSLTQTGSAVVFGGGIDWQMDWGLNLGLEYKTASIGGNSVAIPGFYFGFYF
jgi:hypothetical protein